MYNELIDKCKKAYKGNNIVLAYHFWEQVTEKLDEQLDKCNNDNEKNSVYTEFFKAQEQFTNEEVYCITDYGKRIAYEKMAYDNAMEGYDIAILSNITDEDLSSIDEFCEMYDWQLIKKEDKYNIIDLQTNNIVEEEDMTFDELINRVVGRAIDYFQDEQEVETDEDIEYGRKLYKVAQKHKDGTKWEEDWLNNFKKELEENS